jgi:hypothetical protein
MPPGHSSLVNCVVTMNKNMEKRLFHCVPTEMAVARGTLPPPFKVSEGGQCVNAGIQSKFQNTTKKILHVGLPSDALILSLQESKEVSLHGIATDASGPCIILFLTKTLRTSFLIANTLGTESACVGTGSTCGSCGSGSTMGCGCSGRSRSSGCACKGL